MKSPTNLAQTKHSLVPLSAALIVLAALALPALGQGAKKSGATLR
jgi:hypothetical protein